MGSLTRRARGRAALAALAASTLLMLLGALPSRAHAQRTPAAAEQPKQDYDDLLDRAIEAYDAEDFARAHDLFKRAYALRPNARVLRGLGIAALRLQRYDEANTELRDALGNTDQPLTAAQRDEVTQLLTWMQANLGRLHVRVEPPDAELFVDAEPSAPGEHLVTPGAHRLRARESGFVAQELTVRVAAGQDETFTLSLVRELQQPTAATPALSPKRAAANAESAPIAHSAPLVSTTAPSEAAKTSPSLFGRWWFWTAVGVVAAGGAVAIAAVASNPSTKAYEPGGLGGVIMPLGRKP